MKVSIPPEMQAALKEAVKIGLYRSVDDAVRDGLSVVEERVAKYRALKREIEKGMASPIAGVWDESLAEDVKRRGRERLAKLRAAE